MSKTINISRFDGGMADDYTRGGIGECSVSKHFDLLSYPRRLQPLRAMTTESTTDSKIGNIITASDGLMYGVGTDPNNPTLGKLWVRQGYGASDVWASLSTNQLSGAALRTADYAFLTEYPDAGNARVVFWASTNMLVASNLSGGGGSATTDALTFTNISQGFVHPSDKVLYFGYQTTTATYIGSISANATAFATKNYTALLLPKRYRVYSLTNFGDFLAIGATSQDGAGASTSVVILWDRVTSVTTVSQIIPWGAGNLKVLNNVNGAIVGVSTLSSNATASVQDHDAVQVKVFTGGAEPQLVKEISANRLTTTAPACTINANVNFVYNNRLYFSANVVHGGAAPAYYGLWSFGRTKLGGWAVQIERMATNTGTETGVLAAAIAGDFVCMAHTAVGTLTYTTNGNNLSTMYDATSIYESVINPEMDEADYEAQKQLMTVYAAFLPLPDDAQAVIKYRVDVTQDASGSTLGNGWTTLATVTTNDAVVVESILDSAGSQFTAGRKYEFRIESDNGAILTGFGYKYKVLPTLI